MESKSFAFILPQLLLLFLWTGDVLTNAVGNRGRETYSLTPTLSSGYGGRVGGTCRIWCPDGQECRLVAATCVQAPCPLVAKCGPPPSSCADKCGVGKSCIMTSKCDNLGCRTEPICLSFEHEANWPSVPPRGQNKTRPGN